VQAEFQPILQGLGITDRTFTAKAYELAMAAVAAAMKLSEMAGARRDGALRNIDESRERRKGR
jgi:hypothetical protein